MAELAVAIAAARREWVEPGRRADRASAIGGSPSRPPRLRSKGRSSSDLDGHSAREVEDLYRCALAGDRPRDAACRPHARRTASLRPARPPRAEADGGGDLLDRRAEGAAHRPRARAGAARRRRSPARRRSSSSTRSPPISTRCGATRCSQVLDDLGCQAFMTGTDADVFAPLGDRAQRFKLSDGHISRAIFRRRGRQGPGGRGGAMTGDLKRARRC